MNKPKFTETLQTRSCSECEQDNVEQEIPSSSQFYRFFNPVVEDMEGIQLSRTTELRNSSFPMYQNGTDGIRQLFTLQKGVNGPSQSYSRTSWQRRKENINSEGDLALLADEYTKLKRETEDNDRVITENGVRLNMQDKELEAIIASIAEVCDLNVTLTKNVREVENRKNELAENARKHRVEHLSYETGAMMLESENRELKQEIKKLEDELGLVKDTSNSDTSSMSKVFRDQLEGLRAEIKLEEERSKQLELNLRSEKDKYRNCYFREYTVPSFEEGPPGFGPDKIENYMQDSMNLSDETKPIFSLSAYRKLSPILGSRSVSATPRPENIPQHLNILEPRPSTSACMPSYYRNKLYSLEENAVCSDHMDSSLNPKASYNAMDSDTNIDRSQSVSQNVDSTIDDSTS